MENEYMKVWFQAAGWVKRNEAAVWKVFFLLLLISYYDLYTRYSSDIDRCFKENCKIFYSDPYNYRAGVMFNDSSYWNSARLPTEEPSKVGITNVSVPN